MRRAWPCLLLIPLLVAAEPRHAPHPGGIAVLEVGVAGDGVANDRVAGDAGAPLVKFGERRVLVVRRDDRWLAIVGIPLDREPGPAAIAFLDTTLSFDIEAHRYREQHLTVKPSYVNPPPQQLERIASERRQIDAALARWSERPLSDVTLRAPVDGRRSDSFGSRRFFNKEPRSPHRGMDIASGRGTPIAAPLAAVVALRGDFFFTGNTVILDHGQGLVTLYAHLEEIDVAAKDTVERGARIGTVGATGRVTGPHLHFAAYLNGTPVDPALLLAP
jgi:murein DD-endopeptidase MepM/ murein hydrolase activator NlpD